jgi:hypothetical protein
VGGREWVGVRVVEALLVCDRGSVLMCATINYYREYAIVDHRT